MASFLDTLMAIPGVSALLKGDASYGEVEYADPGLQADKTKRYPIDTPEHIRAAWSYIHHDADAAKYSSADLAHVRERIAAAWRNKIDPKGPPSAAKKIFKAAREEERMVYGFASVSQVAKGADVEDSHGDLITTKALRNLCRGLMKGQRAGKFDHQGAKKTEIVEAVVFDSDLWKAMGDYFEATGVLPAEKAQVFKDMTFEGLLTGFHCEDDATWQLAKDAEFELSIGAERAQVRDL